MYRDYIKNNLKMAQKLKAIIFLGTVRENRLGIRAAKFMKRQMEEMNYEVDFWDPMEMNFTMVSKPVHFYGPERKGAPAHLVECEKRIRDADAYIVVSAEYNHSIPPALSNMLDHFPGSAFSYKPSGIVCYSPGIYGGMRAAIQLRALLGEIGCISVSNMFGIPQINKALSEDGEPLDSHMVSGAKKLLDQLTWNALAMKTHRETHGTIEEPKGGKK